MSKRRHSHEEDIQRFAPFHSRRDDRLDGRFGEVESSFSGSVNIACVNDEDEEFLLRIDEDDVNAMLKLLIFLAKFLLELSDAE